MNKKSFLAVLAAIVVCQGASTAQAFECPQHFGDAQAEINKIMGDIKGMEARMSEADMAVIHGLTDNAVAALRAARHQHLKPHGDYDHARAIAKAEAAHGYALAANILHVNMMKKAKK